MSRVLVVRPDGSTAVLESSDPCEAVAEVCGGGFAERLPEGENLAAERAHQRRFFGLRAGAVQTVDRESVVEFLLRAEQAA